MLRNKTEWQKFDCPVLGGVAVIQITHKYMKADEMPAPQYLRSDFSDCRNKLQCSVAIPTASGYMFDWPKCAGRSTLKTRGS